MASSKSCRGFFCVCTKRRTPKGGERGGEGAVSIFSRVSYWNPLAGSGKAAYLRCGQFGGGRSPCQQRMSWGLCVDAQPRYQPGPPHQARALPPSLTIALALSRLDLAPASVRMQLSGCYVALHCIVQMLYNPRWCSTCTECGCNTNTQHQYQVPITVQVSVAC